MSESAATIPGVISGDFEHVSDLVQMFSNHKEIKFISEISKTSEARNGGNLLAPNCSIQG